MSTDDIPRAKCQSCGVLYLAAELAKFGRGPRAPWICGICAKFIADDKMRKGGLHLKMSANKKKAIIE